MKMKKIISFMLVICMMLTMLPLNVFAAVDEFSITYMAQVDGGSAEIFDAYAASADRAEVNRLVIMQGKTWNGNKFTGWTRNSQLLPIVDSNMKGKPTGIVIDNVMQKIGDEHVGTHHYFIMPAEAVTVYAQYESPKTITISGYQGKGTVSAKAVGEDVYGNGMESTSTDDGSSCTLKAFIGDEVTLNATPNEGYRFVKWMYENQEYGVGETTFKYGMPDVNMDISAVFECAHTKDNDGFCNEENCTHPVDCCPKQYQVTFNANGGKWSDGTDSKSVGTHSNGTVTAPEAPTKEGYKFTGWDGNFNANIVHTADTVYNAQWEINPYTITFDTDGGSTVNPITQDYGTAVTAPANPSKEGYTFAGWDTTIPTTMPAGDMTVKAKWTVNKHNVYYVVDEKEFECIKDVPYGAPIPPASETPVEKGYTFSG